MAHKTAVYVLAMLAGAAFLFLVKLMYDMSVQMARMTEQVTVMTGQMGKLVEDVHGMREGVDRMSGVIQRGGQQLQQLNPMEMMQGVTPGGRPR